MVGLFRLGVGSNTAGIISKKMFERPPRGSREPREMLFGTVPFYAPKSVSFCFLAQQGRGGVGEVQARKKGLDLFFSSRRDLALWGLTCTWYGLP